MSKIDDGGAAFPEAIAIGPAGDVYPGMPGMSRRDYFAAAALTGVIASAQNLGTLSREERRPHFDLMATIIFEIADALIAASKSGGSDA